MIMENVVFVYVDKPRIDAFMELLTEDGYTKVTDVDLGVEQYFSINTKEKNVSSHTYLFNRESANR